MGYVTYISKGKGGQIYMIKTLKKLYLSIILLFLYAPIAVLMLFSFNESRSRGHFTGFTLDWYRQLFQDQTILNAFYTTIIVATLAAIISTAIGTFAALGINKMGKDLKKITLSLNNIPVINPDIVTGISLMMLFLSFFALVGAGQLGFTTLLLANIMFNIPYVILAILPRLKSLDENIYEAALDLGATPYYAFVKVLLPELRPSIITGALIAFTLSIDDFVISYFTTGSGVNTLSMTIFTMTRRGINPSINALSTIMFTVIITLLIIINRRQSIKTSKGAERLNEN
jgi:spermidine/putrescine transport system permease protein